ncbi:CPBP family intramembrane glutamic endopeptidase [Bacillus solimangrovi]|uniref:CAAX prenyl protease 2/Lysostaphin resistance protein A-like domain-containing protein n=1 Tax=Bacillus solimangrovi TaxID=1305675 RepID=A0A1E5LCI5_9BACI|nr:type II CAAX endopeptidase family protein [Bacillus solimangrovi]OEH91729.1 hypothetical protein BFG57_17905 [Bacillus solimangrovi]
MAKQYWYIILTYVFAQFSGLLFGHKVFEAIGLSREDAFIWWTIFAFGSGLIVVFFLLRSAGQSSFEERDRPSFLSSFFWAIGGIFLALFAQNIAAVIEVYVFNVELGSENTDALYQITQISPFFIIVTSLLGPIYEEVIFRKIIFGELIKRTNFWLSALISAVIFGAIHFENEHLLIYSSMGLVFAFLYYKTKRIWVPITAHVMMNSFVILIRFLNPEQFEKIQQEIETAQSFIGGLFL